MTTRGYSQNARQITCPDCFEGLVLLLPYSRKIWWEIKFGSLAVRVETAKLKSANIIFARNTQ